MYLRGTEVGQERVSELEGARTRSCRREPGRPPTGARSSRRSAGHGLRQRQDPAAEGARLESCRRARRSAGGRRLRRLRPRTRCRRGVRRWRRARTGTVRHRGAGRPFLKHPRDPRATVEPREQTQGLGERRGLVHHLSTRPELAPVTSTVVIGADAIAAPTIAPVGDARRAPAPGVGRRSPGVRATPLSPRSRRTPRAPIRRGEPTTTPGRGW